MPTPEVKPAPEGDPTPEVKPAPEGDPTPEVKPAPEGDPTPEVKPAPENATPEENGLNPFSLIDMTRLETSRALFVVWPICIAPIETSLTYNDCQAHDDAVPGLSWHRLH